MDRVNVRPVIHADAPIVRDLIRQLGYELTSKQVEEKISCFSESKQRYAYVAEYNGRVAGFLSLHIIEWFHKTTSTARLSAIVIDDACRGCGIGRILLAFAEKLAIESGCTDVEVSSSLRRKADGTYDFYHSLGYLDASDQSSYFKKKLAS